MKIPAMKNKVYLFLFLSFLLLHCKKSFQGKIQMTYNIEKFDFVNDQMNINIVLENKSLMDLKGGAWELHWNQMKGFVRLNPWRRACDFEWINGAHYFVLKFDKQWSFPKVRVYNFQYNNKARIESPWDLLEFSLFRMMKL